MADAFIRVGHAHSCLWNGLCRVVLVLVLVLVGCVFFSRWRVVALRDVIVVWRAV